MGGFTVLTAPCLLAVRGADMCYRYMILKSGDLILIWKMTSFRTLLPNSLPMNVSLNLLPIALNFISNLHIIADIEIVEVVQS